MPNRKKNKKKQKRAKKATAKAAKKKPRGKTSHSNKSIPKKKRLSKASAGTKRKKPARGTQTLVASRRSKDAAFGRQPADFEGLSREEQADSESVDELVEEGNIFEAGAVAGVEKADNADEREVHTHEVSEDDVPEEYLDKD
jgi:hypothetical protein